MPWCGGTLVTTCPTVRITLAMATATHAAPRLMLLASLLCACGVLPTLSAPTSCYVDSGGPTPATLSSMGATIAAGSNVVCVCYRLICSAGDTACTSAQIASGATRFAYTYVTTSTATQMALTPSIYASMFSCNTTDCNTVSSCAGSSSPPPKPPPPAGSGSNSTTVPASVPASVANSRAPPGAALHFATVLLTALLAVAFF